MLVFHDVTDLRRLERMRQDFVANASHELKTPLASIKAYAETLLDWAFTDESVNRRFLERIDEQVDRLNQLILDMLSLARLESSQEFFEHGPLGVVPVLESCFEGHRGRAEAKNLALTFDRRQPGRRNARPGRRRSRPADLRQPDRQRDQVHARREDRVRVACSLDPDAVTVEVADTGIGIPRDELPRIFERFYRVDKARSRELGGTGLGLSIVKHLISSIRGQISVTSRPGSGSRFTVRLPRVPRRRAAVCRSREVASGEPVKWAVGSGSVWRVVEWLRRDVQPIVCSLCHCHCHSTVATLSETPRLQPFLAVHGGRAARTGGGDGLAVVGVDDVAAGEDPFHVGRRAVVGQGVEQARRAPRCPSMPGRCGSAGSPRGSSRAGP